MQQYIGVKFVEAQPMTRGEFVEYTRQEKVWHGEADDAGYLVAYQDGGQPNHPNFISWCPKEQFENANRPTDGMSFGMALEAAWQGHKVEQNIWDGKGMFVYWVPPAEYPASRNDKGTMLGQFPDDMVPYGGYLAIKTANGNVVPWVPSQTDMSQDGWSIVE